MPAKKNISFSALLNADASQSLNLATSLADMLKAKQRASSYEFDPVDMMDRLKMPVDDWQREVLLSNDRRILTLAHRQSGKSQICSVKALHLAMSKPHQLVLMLSPSLRQSSELFRKSMSAYYDLGQPMELKSSSALRCEFVNNSRIISLPGQEATVRGFSAVDLLIVDEASRVPDELYNAVRPMLLISQGQLMLASTPFGKRGFFHDIWERGSAWNKIHVKASENPRISQEFLAEERETMPELWYLQEYECEFIDTVEQVFTQEMIDKLFGGQSPDPLFQEEVSTYQEFHDEDIVPLLFDFSVTS